MSIRNRSALIFALMAIFFIPALAKSNSKATSIEQGKAQFEKAGQLLWSNGGLDEVHRLYKLSADNGYWEGQLQMGLLLTEKKDCIGSKKYFILAAQQGSLDAMNNLGYHERGSTGCPMNNVSALKWYRIGEMFSKEQSVNVAYVSGKLNPAQIAQAESEATKWVNNHPDLKRKL